MLKELYDSKLCLNKLQKFMLRKLFKIILPIMILFPGLVCAEVNIAVIAPLAGDYEVSGRELVSGAKIAVDEINNNGGLKGQRVNLVVVDDQCNDHLAVSTAQMMAVNASRKDKMNLVVGPFCQNAFGEVSNVYDKAHIMQIVPTSISGQAKNKNHKGLIKMVGYSEHQSLDFFKFYLKNFPDKKVAVAYNSGMRDVVEIAASMQEEFVKAGKMFNFKSFDFAKYNKDYSQMAEDIIDQKYELAYVLGNPKQVAKLSKELKREKDDFAVFINRYQSQGRYMKELGGMANGTYLLSLPTLKDNPEFTETLVKLRLLGIEPEGLSVYSYSAVKLWENMVKKSNSFAYEKLAGVLLNNQFETAWGNISFKNGNPQNVVNYGIYQFYDGEYTQVY